MTSKPIKKVVIVGRDAPAWLAANALSRALGRTGLDIEVIELPSLLRSQDAYRTLPPMEAFHNLLGLDEYALLKAASGTYSLGQSFVNFARTRPPFFHPYGSVGASINQLPFLQFWIKARQSGMKVELEDFSLTAAAAKQGRFFLPTDDLNGIARCDYAYHLKALPYVQYLKSHALRQGVTAQGARLADVQRDGTDGNITRLILSDGREVTGDLFVDATGAESLLLGRAMQVGFESWEKWFPTDRILTASGERLKNLPSYSQVRALEYGCLHLAPLQDSTNLQMVYHGDDMKDETTLETVATVAGLRLHPDAVVSPHTAGRRSMAWAGNCIAIGEAACVMDAIDNTGLHTTQLGLAHLISLFPVDGDGELERREYNAVIQSHFERVRDFQISHFKLNQIFDTPYWDYVRGMTVPETLAHKLATFQARGIVPLYDNEAFQTDSWEAIFVGHGLMPDAYDPLVDLTPQDVAIPNFQRILGFIKAQVQDMSSHDAFLELYASKHIA